MTTTRDPVERFYRHVNFSGRVMPHMESCCHEWISGQTRDYPNFRTEKTKVEKVHRWAWEYVNGPVPAGKEIGHRCDNTICVRVDHLEAISHDQNMKDAKARGLILRGEQAPRVKLTEAKVRLIRQFAEVLKTSQAELGKLYGVSGTVIHGIIHRRLWAHCA